MKRSPMQALAPLTTTEASTIALMAQGLRSVTHNPMERERLKAMHEGARRGAVAPKHRVPKL